jgi:hypothetical protein
MANADKRTNLPGGRSKPKKPLTVGKGTKSAPLVNPGRGPRPVSSKPSQAGLVRSAQKTTTDKGRSGRQSISRAQVTTSQQRGNRRASSTAQVTRGQNSGSVTKPTAGSARTTAGMSGQARDTRRFQAMNQSASARAGKAAEPKPRTPAPGTGNVLKAAQQFSKDKAAKDREIRRQAATNRTALNRQMVGKAALLLGGPKALAVKAVAETVAPRPTAKGTLSAGGAQGPAMPKRLEQQGLAAQETKARKALTARKKATGSKEATPNTAASFDDAFKDARRAKVKTFTWRGKKYTTEMK